MRLSQVYLHHCLIVTRCTSNKYFCFNGPFGLVLRRALCLYIFLFHCVFPDSILFSIHLLEWLPLLACTSLLICLFAHILFACLHALCIFSLHSSFVFDIICIVCLAAQVDLTGCVLLAPLPIHSLCVVEICFT